MAMVKCKECGKEVSNKAKSCPQCGALVGSKHYGCGTLFVVLLAGAILVPIIVLITAPTPERQEIPKPSNSSIISSAEYGKKWAFNISEGRLACDRDAVTFEAGGKKYGLNGVAISRGVPPVDPIWKSNPDIPGTKINIGPFIRRGLKFCR